MKPPRRQVTPDKLVGERIGGRFRVERLIGHGPLSSAFRAQDERLHRRVTVKLFHPQHDDDVAVVEAQLEAASAVARLSHDNIALVIDRGEHEGLPLVVLEYVRGEGLHERIDRYAPLEVSEVVRHGAAIARALTYAHAHGVVHGNLKPSNVLLTEDQVVKLVDFGGGSYVARLSGDPYSPSERANADPGTRAEPLDDVYALGVLLYIALTDHEPGAGVDAAQLQLRRPDLGPRQARAIAGAMSPDPADRLGSMSEFAAALGAGAVQPEPSHIPHRAPNEARIHAGPSEHGRADRDEDTLDGEDHGAGAGSSPEAGPPAAARSTRSGANGRSPRERRARLLAWSMVLVPIAGLVLVGVMIAGERGPTGEGDRPRPKPAVDAVAATPIRIESANIFDPPPQGDGLEHQESIANVFDGDVDTTWDTEGYGTQDLGDKDGVGVILELATLADVREVVIATPLPGWDVQVLVAPAPRADFDDWTRASRATPVKDGVRVAVDGPTEPSGAVLLWATKLALDTQDLESFRARIAEVRVLGVPDGTAAG